MLRGLSLLSLLLILSACSQSSVKTVFTFKNSDWPSQKVVSFVTTAEKFLTSKGYKCWEGTWERTASVGCVGNQNTVTIFTKPEVSGIIVGTDQVLFALIPKRYIKTPEYHLSEARDLFLFFEDYRYITIYREFDFGRREELNHDDFE